MAQSLYPEWKVRQKEVRMKTFNYDLVKDPQYFRDGRLDAH